MKIVHKLIISFLLITILIGVVGYVSTEYSKKTLQKTIGENAAVITAEVLDKINRDIYNKIEKFQSQSKDRELQEALAESNEEFKQLDNIQEYINQKENQWRDAPGEKITPFMQDLMSNELAIALLNQINFYAQTYGYAVIGEVFVTNKYGANAAQTGKTSDYYQADEEWWQNAKEQGLCVTDVAYDESAGIYSIDICIRVDDEEGNFLGVLKAVLNIAEITSIVDEAKAASEYKTTEYDLLNKNGIVIYSTEQHLIFDDLSFLIAEFFKEGTIEHKNYAVTKGNGPGEGDVLYAHAHSKGYKDFTGLDWILLAEYDTKEILAPITKLKTYVLFISADLLLLAVLLGIFLSYMISKPIMRLQKTAIEIGKGNFAVEAKVETKDEIAVLARAINKMSDNLEKYKQEIILEERKRAGMLEKEVKKKTKELDIKLKDAEDMRTATMNMMDDLDIAMKELKTLEKLKADFMNIAAHELKTPLTPMMAYIDLLITEKKGKLKPAQKETMQILQGNIQRLKRLINDILDISRLEAKAMKLDVHKVDMRKVLKDITNEYRPAIQKKKIKLVTKIPKQIPPIWGDYTRLRQVIGNLLSNALKFTDKGIITISAEKEKNSLKVSITDTGTGIKQEQMKKLFTKFFQAETSPERKAEGTGLGLSIVRGIINTHNGKVFVKSKYKKGSTFGFYIPYKGVKARPEKKYIELKTIGLGEEKKK